VKYFIPRVFRRGQKAFARDSDEPIRSELFSIERLEQHAESLANAQRVNAKRTHHFTSSIRTTLIVENTLRHAKEKAGSAIQIT
jgi:hypothetical protein